MIEQEKSKKKKKKKKNKQTAAINEREDSPDSTRDHENQIDNETKADSNSKPEIQLSKSKKKKLKKKAKQQTLSETIEKAQKELEALEQEYLFYIPESFKNDQSMLGEFKELFSFSNSAIPGSTRRVFIPDLLQNHDDNARVTVHVTVKEEDDDEDYEDESDFELKNKKRRKKKKKNRRALIVEEEEESMDLGHDLDSLLPISSQHLHHLAMDDLQIIDSSDVKSFKCFFNYYLVER